VAPDDDLRLLAYVVDLERVRAIEMGRGYTREHDLSASVALLDGYDAVRRELGSPAALSRPVLPALERFASEWGRVLLPDSWLADPPRYGVLIPNGMLHALPLHLIRTDSGRPLCAETGVSLCSSLTLLRRCLERSPGPRRVADPFYGRVPDDMPVIAAGTDVLGANDDAWRRLPVALLEACGDAGRIVDVGPPYDPSLRTVLAEMLRGHGVELAIIAAHGYHNPLDAVSSGLLLGRLEGSYRFRPVSVPGGAPLQTQDLPVRDLPAHLRPTHPAELLSLAELEHAAHLVCPLVALLGCSTGRAVVYPGDQPLSLAEVFLRIGAAAVVAPMWDVTVGSVEAWMRQFLQAYRVEGRSRGDAARLASASRHADGAALHETGCMVLRGDYRERSAL
jgi:CHAT domain-containing protein